MTCNTPFKKTSFIRNRPKNLISGVILTLLIFIGCGKRSAPGEELAAFTVDAEAKLRELGITLPEPPEPVANYVNGVRTGNLIFLAGKGPKRADGSEITGKLGVELSIEEGYVAARLLAINQLSVLKVMLGDLNKVKRIVKVLGMVNSDPLKNI